MQTAHGPVTFWNGVNLAHAQHPIYLVQGVYLPDESYIQTHDLWAKNATAAFSQELLDASAAVSGQLVRTPVTGRTSGTWDADVSQWLAAWIICVEWDPIATSASDKKNVGKPEYHGKYFVSNGNGGPASSTDQWIAARMDELATQEVRRGRSEPIAFANWPTADPLKRHFAQTNLPLMVTEFGVPRTPSKQGGGLRTNPRRAFNRLPSTQTRHL